jgi:HD superfamily phosphohydrolase
MDNLFPFDENNSEKSNVNVTAMPPYNRPHKTFGIAVSGDVILNRLEVEIINTKDFQRLRKIKQLGSTDLVYPSANHTRFEHSLGVLKKADRIIRFIRENKHSSIDQKNISEEEEQIIRLIALLHDIGHMPYGHTIEDEFGIFPSHDKHEERWHFYLGEDSEIGTIIIHHMKIKAYSRFFQLIKCEKNFKGFEEDAFMYDIVSNTVCADLLDYLERDCMYTNLKLNYHPRFLNYFHIFTDEDKKHRRIGIRIYKTGSQEIRHDVLSELIQLLRNRYYLGERVYYHHTKIKTGTMIAGAVLRAKKAGVFDILKKSNGINGKSIYDIHCMGDDELLLFLRDLPLNSSNNIEKKHWLEGAKSLAESIERRLIYEQVYYKSLDEIGNIDSFVDVTNNNYNISKETSHLQKIFMGEKSSENRLEIEDEITKYLPYLKSGDLLIYCPKFNMSMKLAKAKVVFWEKGEETSKELKDFNFQGKSQLIVDECKEILKRHHHLWALRVFVHPDIASGKRFAKEPNISKEYYKEFLAPLLKAYCDWKFFLENDPVSKENEVEFFRLLGEDYYKELHQSGYMTTLDYSDVSHRLGELAKELTSNQAMKRDRLNIEEAIIHVLEMKKKL